MIAKINEAVASIQRIYPIIPTVGIVLGSGLGSFTGEMTIEKEIHYSDIPHFPVNGGVARRWGSLAQGIVKNFLPEKVFEARPPRSAGKTFPTRCRAYDEARPHLPGNEECPR